MAADPVSLKELTKISNSILMAEYRIKDDLRRRREDVAGAWDDADTLRDRLRVIALTPFSGAEHLTNRIPTGTGTRALRLAFKLGLRSVRKGPEAQAYGFDLAQRVVDRLTLLKVQSGGADGVSLCNTHRDYCGTGLFHGWPGEAPFHYGYAEDGFPSTSLIKFDDAPQMVDWLARQSDLTLSGVVGPPPLLDWDRAGNQRLTRARLDTFVGAP